jgi:selenium metabolism protein YedF
MHEKLDLRKLPCPEPVLKAKKALERQEVESLEVYVDDQVNLNNLKRLAQYLKLHIEHESFQDGFKILISKQDPGQSSEQRQASPEHIHNSPLAQAINGATPKTGAGQIVFLNSDSFGTGDPAFSKTLLNVFLQTLFEAGHRPQAILMVNTAVKIMDPNNPTLKVLDDFKAAGCEVLACGLCVEFYGLKGKIAPEQITNMFAIVEYLTSADKVIYPS